MISTPNINQARKEIQKLKKNKEQIIVKAQDSDFNRKILEIPEIDIFLSPEIHNRKDNLKQRDSGLNEILCKLAKKNNIKIGINIKEIINLPKKEKAILLSRIIQNINLCKKTRTKMIFYPPIPKQEALSFFLSLKSSSKQASESFK